MFDITLCILVVQVHTCLAQFSNHIDLQKAGEVIFNNDKYNLLKPTKHIITDYSKEFMLRSRNKNFPTDRIFIDNNGFRHFWGGFDKIIKNLRKHEVDTQKKHGANFDENMQRYTPDDDSIENINQNYTDTDFTETSSDITIPRRKNTSLLWYYYNTAKHSESKPKLRKAKYLPEKDNNIKNKTKIAKPKKVNNAAASKVPNSTKTKKRPSKSTSTPKPKRRNTAAEIKAPPTTKPKNKIIKNTTTSKTKKVNKASTTKSKTKSIKNATAPSAATAATRNETPGGDSGAADGTAAHTTFFCPFLGVVTVSAFVD